MKFAASLFLASAAAAAVLPYTAPATSVHLAAIDNTHIGATIINTGAQALWLLQRGTILGPHPVRKIDVHADDGTLRSLGL
jgi:hypothetical protein